MPAFSGPGFGGPAPDYAAPQAAGGWSAPVMSAGGYLDPMWLDYGAGLPGPELRPDYLGLLGRMGGLLGAARREQGPRSPQSPGLLHVGPPYRGPAYAPLLQRRPVARKR
jgi:hypothetical protein